jgi:redox-sensitive bicupin YhaK (pirin superfamily)
MITIRPANERGNARYSWLDTHYTFSFADYIDRNHMGFRSLRVINEDIIAPATGFPPHSHRDMEIITYILSGTLQHKDSLGHTSMIQAGEVQRMSAGSGITHSEMNPSPTEPVHLLQIWILPDRKDIAPDYEQRLFTDEHQHGQLKLLVHPEGKGDTLTIHQDAMLFSGVFDSPDDKVSYSLPAGRYAWIQVSKGSVQLNSRIILNAGDGAAISEEEKIEITGAPKGEILLFDLK